MSSPFNNQSSLLNSDTTKHLCLFGLEYNMQENNSWSISSVIDCKVNDQLLFARMHLWV